MVTEKKLVWLALGAMLLSGGMTRSAQMAASVVGETSYDALVVPEGPDAVAFHFGKARNAIDQTARGYGLSDVLLRAQRDGLLDVLFNYRSAAGATLLSLAAGSNRGEVLEELLNYGADINSLCSSNGHTALASAVALGNAETVAMLLEHGARLDIPGYGLKELRDMLEKARTENVVPSDDPEMQEISERMDRVYSEIAEMLSEAAGNQAERVAAEALRVQVAQQSLIDSNRFYGRAGAGYATTFGATGEVDASGDADRLARIEAVRLAGPQVDPVVASAMQDIVAQVKAVAGAISKRTKLTALVAAFNREHPGRGISAAHVQKMNEELGLVTN